MWHLRPTIIVDLLFLQCFYFKSYFLAGGFALGPQMGDLVQEACQSICAQLKPDIVAVVDAIAHPDAVVQSILGHSDGEVSCG